MNLGFVGGCLSRTQRTYFSEVSCIALHTSLKYDCGYLSRLLPCLLSVNSSRKGYFNALPRKLTNMESFPTSDTLYVPKLLYNPARRPDSIKPPRLLGSKPSYTFVAIVLHHLITLRQSPLPQHCPRLTSAAPPCPITRFLLSPVSCLLPTSVFSTNLSMSTMALSSDSILRFLRSGVPLSAMSLALSLCTKLSCSLRHFQHSSKRCFTVCYRCITSSVSPRLRQSSYRLQ